MKPQTRITNRKRLGISTTPPSFFSLEVAAAAEVRGTISHHCIRSVAAPSAAALAYCDFWDGRLVV
jgi:hypothetical protein